MNEYTQQPNIDDTLNPGTGSGSGRFYNVKDLQQITGTLINAEIRRSSFNGKPTFYDKDAANPVKPIHEVVLTLSDTDQRDIHDSDDDGMRRVAVKEYGPARDALAEELTTKGFTEVDANGAAKTKISLAFGHQITVKHVGAAPRAQGESQGKKLLAFEIHKGTRKETRPAPAMKETRNVQQLLKDAGLPDHYAAMLGDNPAPELIKALQDQEARK